MSEREGGGCAGGEDSDELVEILPTDARDESKGAAASHHGQRPGSEHPPNTQTPVIAKETSRSRTAAAAARAAI